MLRDVTLHGIGLHCIAFAPLCVTPHLKGKQTSVRCYSLCYSVLRYIALHCIAQHRDRKDVKPLECFARFMQDDAETSHGCGIRGSPFEAWDLELMGTFYIILLF